MKSFNDLLQELGVSKVKLAKYLGVSRQMVYNYLDLDSLEEWPNEKKLLIYKLLDITDGSEKSLGKIKVTPEYSMEIENKLNIGSQDSFDAEALVDLKKLSREEKDLYKNLTYLLKDKFSDEYKHDENIATLTYMYHLLQSMDNVKEVKYMLAYMSKSLGFTNPDEFKFNENQQFSFEGIVHSAFTLYSSGGASKTKVMESHARFVQEIEQKKEEKLARTAQLNVFKEQALKELGYSSFTPENAQEFIEKLAEIECRASSSSDR